MSGSAGLLYLAVSALAGLLVFYLYRRRELPVRGRVLMAAFRWSALCLVLLLLFDPSLPDAPAGGAESTWVLVDGSRSMSVPWEGASLWDRALIQAADEIADGGGRPVSFGDGISGLTLDGSDAFPAYRRSSLAPALERAVESGARSVIVVSDGRFDDADRAMATAERLGLELRLEVIGEGIRNAGIGDIVLPPTLREGQSVEIEASVFAVGAEGEEAVLEVREEGRVVDTRSLVLPGEGRTLALDLALPAPEEGGERAYEFQITLEGDLHPEDDRRLAVAEVNPSEGNLVLISFRPDWEFKFLLPVLERVTGLPARGFIRLGPDLYLSMGETGEGTADLETVQRMAGGAELLVVQGPTSDHPWIRRPLDLVRRSIVFADSPAESSLAGFEVGAPRAGEWFASPEVPGSPLTAELTGVIQAGFPPLSGLIPVTGEPQGFVPLQLQLRGGGPSEAALVLYLSDSGARRALVLAQGFWRWASRSGPSDDAYGRLWSGVAGWLLADEPLARGPGVRPESRVATEGEPLAWTASGLVGDTIALRLTRADTLVLDTSLVVPDVGRFGSPPLPPGQYLYAAGGLPATPEWSGYLDVEAWSGDLRPPRSLMELPPRVVGPDGPSFGSRPMRTHPLPYLLILALLCSEWVVRRRRGLR